MLTKPRAELLYLGRHPPLKKSGFLHGPGCTRPLLPCVLTQGFDLIASQQNKGENYHQSYCNPYGSLLPVNAFPNGESTDFGDSGKGQKDGLLGRKAHLLVPWAWAGAVREWHSTYTADVHFLPLLSVAWQARSRHGLWREGAEPGNGKKGTIFYTAVFRL